MRSNQRGMALITTLMFVVVMFIGAMALAEMAMDSLHGTNAARSAMLSLQTSEAGLAEVQNQLNTTPTFGSAGECASGTLSDGATWTCQFSTATTPPASCSVNNIYGTSAITRADGSVVPPYSVDVIITPSVKNATSTNGSALSKAINNNLMAAGLAPLFGFNTTFTSSNTSSNSTGSVGVIMSNGFAWAVGSSGTFSATGDLSIEGASSLAVVQSILNGSSTGDLPGKMAANSTANPSVSTSGNPTITGYVETPGTPKGKFTSQYGTVSLPKLTWSFYTPSATDAGYQLLTSVPATLSNSGGKNEYYVNGNATISGGLTLTNVTLSVNGNLTVSGSLNLQNSKIYTNGNLNINGGIKDGSGNQTCTGSIYVCGSSNTLSISGASNLSPSNNTGVALCSQGSIAFTGGASTQGITYADGNITATGGATFVGITIANANTTTQVEDSGGATFIYCPVYSQMLSQATLKMQRLSWRIIN